MIRPRMFLKGADFARRAPEVAGDDPGILAPAGHALASFGEDIGAMMALIDRALTFNPLADIRTLQMFDHGEPPLPLCDASATGSTVQCQHEHDVGDPPSIIKLFQQHPSDIPPVDTVEAIRMQEAVALLIRPGMHVVAVTQNHTSEHREAG